MPMVRFSGSAQSSSVISSPSGRIQVTSFIGLPSLRAPVRKSRRRSTGLSATIPMSWRTNSQSSVPVSSMSQSTQLISLSWQ